MLSLPCGPFARHVLAIPRFDGRNIFPCNFADRRNNRGNCHRHRKRLSTFSLHPVSFHRDQSRTQRFLPLSSRDRNPDETKRRYRSPIVLRLSNHLEKFGETSRALLTCESNGAVNSSIELFNIRARNCQSLCKCFRSKVQSKCKLDCKNFALWNNRSN